jgi:hypothetical protein
MHRPAVYTFVLCLVYCHDFRRYGRWHRRLAKRHTFGSTMPTRIGIAIAMERKGSWPLVGATSTRGHPKAGALWEKYINKILDDLDIGYTEVRSTGR